MALTLASKPANQEGYCIRYTGGIGVNDNDILLEIDSRGADEVFLGSSAGAVDVFGSIDGTNFFATALALEDMTSTTPQTRVALTTAGKVARIVSSVGYAKLRFMQNGATAVADFSVAVRVIN